MMRYLKPCVFAATVAVLATPAIEWQVNRRRLAEFRQHCERLAYRLDIMPAQSMAQGATATLGSTQEAVRGLAEGRLPPQAPEVVALLRRFARSIGADNALVLDRAGRVVADARRAEPGPVRNLGTRPYFEAAIQGRSSLYAALGGSSGERGIYVAAPVAAPGVAPVGVVVAKMGFEAVDGLLRGETGRFALVSPEGVVFAANVPDWVFRVEAGTVVATVRQLPRTAAAFASREPRALPRGAGFRRRVELPIDWLDPGGPWKLIGLPDPDQLFTAVDRLLLGGMLFLTAFLAGAVWLERRPCARASSWPKRPPRRRLNSWPT